MEQQLPAKFQEFGEARKAGFLRVKQLKEQGGRVAGTFCTFTPLEILDAAGFTAVSLCGMSQETIGAAEAHLPANLCPLIKSSYGFAVSDKCPYTYFSDLIVGETTCDGKKKMYELLGRLKPVYVLYLPRGWEGYALDMWTGELRRFMAYLEERFGVTITDEALRDAARQRNAERRALPDLMAVQKLSPPPAFGQQLYTALGGAVVCFENCTGVKAALQMVDADAPDIVRAIAARYLDIGCAVMTPDTNRMALLRLLERLRRELPEGAVLHLCGKMTQCLLDTGAVTAEKRRYDAAAYSQALMQLHSEGKSALLGHFCVHRLAEP